MLEIGTKAPAFTLPDQNGNMHSLKEFAGEKVLLYFYPKDNTSGCTKQAVAFAGLYDEIRSLGAEVIGISRDSSESHVRFAEKYSLPFPLLSDPDHRVTEEYGAWQEKKLYGKVSLGVVRTTVIIGKTGIIEKIMSKVKADTNAADVLDLLK